MLSSREFVARWGKEDTLVRLSPRCLERLAILDEDKQFLSEAGLPEDAAPFLSFELAELEVLPTVADEWDLGRKFRRFRKLGSDGSGNPIAIDEDEQGEIVLLDHERRFARTLMNTSIRQLAMSLLAFRTTIEDAQSAFGAEAFPDGKISKAAWSDLRKVLTIINPAAMKPNHFWFSELQVLDANGVI